MRICYHGVHCLESSKLMSTESLLLQWRLGWNKWSSIPKIDEAERMVQNK